jgi:HSP20 family molecular chaperone IbpA
VLPILRNRLGFASRTARSNATLDVLSDRFVGDDDYFSPVWAGLPVAVWEDANHVYAEADLPGVAEEDLDVTVEDGRVFIRGARKPDGGRGYLYDGRSYGPFERVIILPDAVADDPVTVVLSRGVLTIALARTARPTLAGASLATVAPPTGSMAS